MLTIDPTDAVPIWRQIEEGVGRLVASGALAPGAPVPSVRDLARDLKVNPATVAKAYQRLVEAGLLLVRRGEGTFVADRPPALTAADRRRILGDAASRYAVVAANIGSSRVEALAQVESALAALPRRQRGGKS